MAAERHATTLTAHASANTKATTYTEFTASLGLDAKLLTVMVPSDVATRDFLIDLATGAASSEVDFITNLRVSGTPIGAQHTAYYCIPVNIASGSRISGRIQSSTGGADIAVYLSFSDYSGVTLSTGMTAMGVNTADSGGTSIDPGPDAFTKYDYVELEDSTASAYTHLWVAIGGQLNTARASGEWALDVATGAAASESIIIASLDFRQDTAESLSPLVYGPFPVSISASTRLSARASSGVTDATDRLFDVTLYGVNAAAIGGSGGGTQRIFG